MTRLVDRLDVRALRSVQAVQVENPWMLKYVREVVAGHDVDVRYAPPGVDVQVFCPMPTLDLERNPYILCVGRLGDPRKNIELLLRSYGRLSAAIRQRVRLVVAGSSSPPDAFWKAVGVLGLGDRIKPVIGPSRAELVALYQSATVFVLPSDEEGLGIVLLEAMACGVPVVSTCSGGPDGIIKDGKNGYLVPLDDEVALSTRLEHLLTDFALNRAIGRAGRLTVEQDYSEQVTGQAFLNIWDRLLAGESA